MSGKILVIGATGNIGRPLVDSLVARGERVKAASHPDDLATERKGLEVVAFDLCDPGRGRFSAVLEDVDRVFTITVPTESDPEKQIGPLIDAAKSAGVRHFVLVSSMGTEEAPEEFGGKRLELRLIASGMDYTILRPGWFMQGMQAPFVAQAIRREGRLALPVSAESVFSLIDARDIAAVAALALTEQGHAGKAYTLTGVEALNIGEVAECISASVSRPIRVEASSVDELRAQIERNGGYPGPLEHLDILFEAVAEGGFGIVDPTLGQVLGREPTRFAQFALENSEAWRDESQQH